MKRKIYIQVRRPNWLKFAYRKIGRIKKRKQRKQARERAEENRYRLTPAEQFFKNRLKENNIRFISQKVCFYKKSKYRIIDFYLPDYRLNIEIDGGYHDEDTVKRYDEYKDSLTKHETLRFRNEEIYKSEFWLNFLEFLNSRSTIQPRKNEVCLGIE